MKAGPKQKNKKQTPNNSAVWKYSFGHHHGMEDITETRRDKPRTGAGTGAEEGNAEALKHSRVSTGGNPYRSREGSNWFKKNEPINQKK